MVAGPPFLEHEGPGADHDLVERVRAVETTWNIDGYFVCCQVPGLGPDLLQEVIREHPVRPGPQREIGGIDALEVNDRGVIIGGVYVVDLIPAAGRNEWRRVLVSILEPPEVEGRLYVLGRKRDAIVPLDASAQLPGDVHPVAADLDIPVFQRGHFGGQLWYPVVGEFRAAGQRVLVGPYGEQAFHRRVDVGAGMRLGGRDIAGQQAVLLLPGGNRDLPARLDRGTGAVVARCARYQHDRAGGGNGKQSQRSPDAGRDIGLHSTGGYTKGSTNGGLF